MNSNRRWVAMAFFFAGLLTWVLTSKFLSAMMGLTRIDAYDWHLLGDNFTLTTLIGLVVALVVGTYCYRHPTISTLSNEVVAELKKVTWPNARETRAATFIVIITVIIMAVFLGIFDLVWSNLLDYIYPNVQVG